MTQYAIQLKFEAFLFSFWLGLLV
uniref:Uncharacterized protein n=1 Tax=Rhizophora mucronata TaxID=61149 RepID=A0A2P2Q088_RHIMU